MSKESSPSPPCRSIFREGSAAATKEKYTQLWITLICQMERGKRILAGAE